MTRTAEEREARDEESGCGLLSVWPLIELWTAGIKGAPSRVDSRQARRVSCLNQTRDGAFDKRDPGWGRGQTAYGGGESQGGAEGPGLAHNPVGKDSD
jgi:hypothetical protein